MRILVASTNPNKLEGTKRAFAEFPEIFGPAEKFVIEGKKFPSGVPDQPVGYEQAIMGAYNRASNARPADTTGIFDFYVGIESTIVFVKNKPHAVTYACVMDRAGMFYFGTSSLFPLPLSVVETLTKGEEMAAFAEKITGVHDVRSKGGITSFLFKGKWTRTYVNESAVKGALAGFIRKQAFSHKVDMSKLPKSVYVSVSISGGIVKDLPLQIMQWIEETGAVVNDKHVVYAGHDVVLRQKYMQEYARQYFDMDVPLHSGQAGSSQEFDRLIYELDTYLVDAATHIVVVLEKTSFGVGMEIERALTRPARGLPEAKILGLIHKDALPKLSKMVTGAAVKYENFIIRPYREVGDIKKLVKEFLG